MGSYVIVVINNIDCVRPDGKRIPSFRERVRIPIPNFRERLSLRIPISNFRERLRIPFPNFRERVRFAAKLIGKR